MTQYSLADGGTVTVTSAPTGDANAPYLFTLQKYDANGAAVGAADQFSGQGVAVDALSNGGYVVTENDDGFHEGVFVFGPNGGASPTAVGVGLSNVVVAASPQGGFLLEHQVDQPHGLPRDGGFLGLYDNSGALLGDGVLYGVPFGQPAAIGLDSQGDYVLQSNGAGQPTTLVVAPGDPTALHGPPAPTVVGAYDDVGARQGWLSFAPAPYSGGLSATQSTDDPQLTFRVSVSQPEIIAYELDFSLGSWVKNQVTVTAQDVANGYIDIPLTTWNGVAPPANTNLSVSFVAVNPDTGVIGGASQTFSWTEGPDPGVLSIAGPGAQAEGTGGTTDFAFTVTRSGDTSAAAMVDYYRAYGGSADSSDFAGPTAGTVSFAAGQSTATIHIAVNADATPEPDKTFTIALANPRGATIDANASSASATIVNDDSAASLPPGAIALADGGYVLVTAGSNNDSLVQKYDAHGAAVGAAFDAHNFEGVTALSNGGYLVLDREAAPYGADIHLFNSEAAETDHLGVGGATTPSNEAASPNGGFLVAGEWFTGHQDVPDPTLTLYDNAGNVLAMATYEYGADPAVSVDGAGRYVVSRSDLAPLTVDPADPANAFHSPAAISGQIVGIDDSGPLVGQFGAGAYTDDHTPTLRIPVQQAGGIEIYYSGAGTFSGWQKLEAPVTATDLANGYVDVTLNNVVSDATQVTAQVSAVSKDGLVGPTTSFSFNLGPTLAAAAIFDVDGFTSGARPIQDPHAVVDVLVSNQQIGDTIQLFDNGVAVTDPLLLTAAMLPDERDMIALHPTLTQGANHLVARSDDGQGHVIDSAGFDVTVGQTLFSITGPGAVVDGTSGTTDYAFTVARTGDTSAGAAVDFYQAYGGTADSSDFASPTAGTVYFDPGQSSATIHIAVNGEPAGTPDQTFILNLGNGRGADIDPDHGSATATIVASSGGSTGGSTSVTTSDASYTAPEGVTSITLTGTSSQTVHANDAGDTIYSNNNGNILIGGTGDDTFVLGRNGDQVTGGGGHDTFVFQQNPWSPSGVITDFTSNDVIDLSGTLQKAGYASGDAVAEGFLKFTNDASGNAQVWFNPEPNGSGTFWLVTGLTGVDAASLHANAGLITI